MEFIKENWLVLLLGLIGFIEVIVRLTPSEKDNTILEWVKKILNIFIPNLSAKGGKFTGDRTKTTRNK